MTDDQPHPSDPALLFRRLAAQGTAFPLDETQARQAREDATLAAMRERRRAGSAAAEDREAARHVAVSVALLFVAVASFAAALS